MERQLRPTGLTGAAGEYYVAAELSLRGWLATVTIKNAPGTDVLARHLVSGVPVSIQTKTSSGGSFTLTEKDEQLSTSAHDWYVLVGLEGFTTRPRFHVIPRDHVAACIYALHREWLSRSSKSGQPHRDNPRRGIPRQRIVRYQDKWDLLTSPPANAPWLFDQFVTDCVRGFGRDHDRALLLRPDSSGD